MHRGFPCRWTFSVCRLPQVNVEETLNSFLLILIRKHFFHWHMIYTAFWFDNRQEIVLLCPAGRFWCLTGVHKNMLHCLIYSYYSNSGLRYSRITKINLAVEKTKDFCLDKSTIVFNVVSSSLASNCWFIFAVGFTVYFKICLHQRNVIPHVKSTTIHVSRSASLYLRDDV